MNLSRLPILVVFYFIIYIGHAQEITYGTSYYLKNNYRHTTNNILDDSSYLDTCGAADCSNESRWKVMTSSIPDRQLRKTSEWKILSVQGGKIGAIVENGDIVYLENQYTNSENGKTYLDVCGGANCTVGTKLNVSTSIVKNRGTKPTGQWKIIKVNATGSINVKDNIYLQSMYTPYSYLDTCGGANCGGTSLWDVSTNSQIDRSGKGTSMWHFENVIANNETRTTVAHEYISFNCTPSPSQKETDGCSNPGNNAIANSYRELFDEACVSHDACYASPWHKANFKFAEGQDKCDERFLDDMISICNNTNFELGVLGRTECLSAAEALYFGVQKFGAGSFLSGQNWANEKCIINDLETQSAFYNIYVKNNAAYNTFFTVSYYLKTTEHSYESPSFTTLTSHILQIPEDSKNIKVTIYADPGRQMIKEYRYTTMKNKCFKIVGSLFDTDCTNCIGMDNRE